MIRGDKYVFLVKIIFKEENKRRDKSIIKNKAKNIYF